MAPKKAAARVQRRAAVADGIGMRIAEHWVAHTRGNFRGVCGGKSARWLWQHLKAAFPGAYALCLMPDHVHLVVPGGADFASFQRVLAHHGRRFGCSWNRADATPCTTREILVRAIRYAIINPVRAGLVTDPWAWPWSTLRELGSAVVDDWTRAQVRRVVRGTWARLLERMSHLDDGTVPPVPGSGDPCGMVISLDTIAAAVASTLRVELGEIQQRGRARRLFVQLAFAAGRPRHTDLAQACGVAPQAIREAARVTDEAGLRCALRCLQDDRLRIHDVMHTAAAATGASRRSA